MSDLLRIQNLEKHYDGFDLEGISLSVPTGSVVGFIGSNGAGKTTTIKAILGLIHRDGGSVQVLGREVTEGSDFRADIGVVLDESAFHDPLKAPQVGKILAGTYRNWDTALFDAYLDRFQLPRNKKIKEFSKGMKMKLSIASALAHHPRLLILDEATAGLDPVVRNELLDEFLTFIQDEDHAVLLSSHITSDLEKAADYVTYLHKGRAVLQGTKDELLDTYGRLVCSRADLAAVDAALLEGTRVSQFGCEALVKDRQAFRRRYPDLTVDPVTLEDIMVFTVRGDET